MPKTVEFNQEVCDQIVALRDTEEKKWGEIGEAMGVPDGKCMLMYSWAKVPKTKRIKNATAEDIVRLRDEESLSWGDIIARTSYPENACRSLYEEGTGKSTRGLRIGKGGRYPKGLEPEGDGEAPAKRTRAKAEPKAKAAKPTQTAGNPLEGISSDEIKEKLTGYALKVQTDEGEEVIRVSAVKRVTNTTIVVQDAVSGSSRTVKRAAVLAVSKKKVA